ncbi:MAG: hypothetical protein JJD92_03155 [Frankiaceae bacterium]|nr:hypothetical protein [Frankiaceae bacterium]
MLRPFEGRTDETEWIALREVVPAATAPLRLRDEPDREVTLSTVLPLNWPAMVRADGRVFLGLQVPTRSGDVSRDLAAALELALASAPGSSVQLTDLPGPGPRLQDLLDDAPIEVTVHDGFDYWIDGAPAADDEDEDDDVAASMERANATVVPTVRLSGVPSAYWCRMKERAHLRWVLPEDEDDALNALARVAADGGLGIGPDTRYVGAFRAHGLLVPVWDLPIDRAAADLEQPILELRARLDEALTRTEPLTTDERRARAGLTSRQITLR